MKKIVGITSIMTFVSGAFGQFTGGVGDGFDQNIAAAISLNETIASTPLTVPTLTEWGVVALVIGLAVAACCRVKKLNATAHV